ncbi:MAG: hypothetical protein DMG92_15590 [Acidobacteria bacterium]|nr:MAG: hypothetical protein DMG92_15590 [Acidobacteriota bacterium]
MNQNSRENESKEKRVNGARQDEQTRKDIYHKRLTMHQGRSAGSGEICEICEDHRDTPSKAI